MVQDIMKKKIYLVPLLSYLFVVVTILLMRTFLKTDYIYLISALIMILIPYALMGRVEGLDWNYRAIFKGLVISVVILMFYAFILVVIFKRSINFGALSIPFVLTQLIIVAYPEEVFFRGYLQSKIGNNMRGIIIVSVLFAIGHLCTMCLPDGFNNIFCLLNVLTFFPSVIMGYLYFATGNLWTSIIFHFLGNITNAIVGGI